MNSIHFSGSLRLKLWLLKGMVALSSFFCLQHDNRILGFTGFGLCGCCGSLFIFGLLYFSYFTGFLPVISRLFWCNSLIINAIHFSDSLRVKLWLLKGM
jgi:hypothetical protein